MDAQLYVKQRSQSSVLTKQAKKNSLNAAINLFMGLLCVCAIFRIKHVAKKNSTCTGVRLASKEIFFATCFILNIVHTHKRPMTN